MNHKGDRDGVRISCLGATHAELSLQKEIEKTMVNFIAVFAAEEQVS